MLTQGPMGNRCSLAFHGPGTMSQNRPGTKADSCSLWSVSPREATDLEENALSPKTLSVRL